MPKKRLLFLLVFSFLLIQISNAQICEKFIGGECSELQWERAPATLGEVAEIAIAPTNPDIMYAGIEVNSHSLYRSIDGGKTWRRVNGGGDYARVFIGRLDPAVQEKFAYKNAERLIEMSGEDE